MLNRNPLSTTMATIEKFSKYDRKQKVDGSTYRSLVRSLIYLNNTQPDKACTINIVSRFRTEPSKAHFAVVIRILRYVKKHEEVWSSI